MVDFSRGSEKDLHNPALIIFFVCFRCFRKGIFCDTFHGSPLQRLLELNRDLFSKGFFKVF